MTFWLAIRRLLPVLAILGLVFSPFVAPALAGGVSASMSAMVVGDDMATATDMPCCPPEKPATPDCLKACPLLALCLAKTVQSVPSAASMLVRIGVTEALVPRSDALPDTLAQGPPSRPPQA